MAERHQPESAELRRLRRRIDALDRRIVRLLNERAELARDVGREKVAGGRRAIRDAEREREVLLRVSMANDGPTPQADLIAIFKRLFAVARTLERRDRGLRLASVEGNDGPRPRPRPVPVGRSAESGDDG
jgi:chorismate mutase